MFKFILNFMKYNGLSQKNVTIYIAGLWALHYRDYLIYQNLYNRNFNWTDLCFKFSFIKCSKWYIHKCMKRNTYVTSPRHKLTSSLTFLFKSKLHSWIFNTLPYSLLKQVYWTLHKLFKRFECYKRGYSHHFVNWSIIFTFTNVTKVIKQTKIESQYSCAILLLYITAH